VYAVSHGLYPNREGPSQGAFKLNCEERDGMGGKGYYIIDSFVIHFEGFNKYLSLLN
jgi:hypothetical protein